ncbi:unnamed protein product [Knipowitschia caucasica]|uniref:Centrosomal protein of 44 kDa n=1 Tax=Knipowitschia caucasica TaxID=637954 RepID=A0AAV2LQ43_KNICA
MLPTGDVQGGIRKLESLIRSIKYTGPVSYSSLTSGDPAAFLPIVSYTLTSFSPAVTEQIVASGFELTAKTDLRFIDTVYKVLRDVFQYKPVLTKEQFLQWGFSQRKISVVCDVISLVLERHNLHKRSKPKSRFSAPHKNVKVETISFADLENAVPAKPLVVNHVENPSSVPVSFSQNQTASSKMVKFSVPVESFSSESREHGVVEMRGAEEQETSDRHCCAELMGRLSALEARVEALVSGLNRIAVLEQRLEEMERLKSKDKTQEQPITVSRETWENLQSRILLLETKLELSRAKENIPPPSSPPSASFVPSVLYVSTQPSVKGHTSRKNEPKVPEEPKEPESQDDFKERLERITNMMKSTSSLLRSVDNCSK